MTDANLRIIEHWREEKSERVESAHISFFFSLQKFNNRCTRRSDDSARGGRATSDSAGSRRVGGSGNWRRTKTKYKHTFFTARWLLLGDGFCTTDERTRSGRTRKCGDLMTIPICAFQVCVCSCCCCCWSSVRVKVLRCRWRRTN